jgi:hypothetical protein
MRVLQKVTKHIGQRLVLILKAIQTNLGKLDLCNYFKKEIQEM